MTRVRFSLIVVRWSSMVVLLFQLLTSPIIVYGGSDSGNTASTSDFICGPRCVKFILSQYSRGEDLELLDLVKKLQWPELERGCTLNDIEELLKSEGIYCKSVYAKPHDLLTLRWNYPVILHLVDAGQDNVGHFVVLLPNADASQRSIKIWNGLNGYQKGEANQLKDQLSGYALITSPKPLRRSDLVIYAPADTLLSQREITALFGVVSGGLAFLLYLRGRCPWINYSNILSSIRKSHHQAMCEDT